MSKYMSHVQHVLFKHYTRKILRNNKIKNMLDYIST